ncbi:MAG: shikimate kinase AroK [Pseudomonadales bacterium]|nr:shikimate kinase AroK [Pseudomonadales bacterium]
MKSSLDNIFLVGPMGAGKTTIGRLLASEMQLEFVDSDAEIEQRSGASISWIFDVEGEPGFRLREKKIIAELTERKGMVLATGGGVVLDSQNRKFLQGRGVVIYLMTTVSQQAERTRRDQKRPLLQNVQDPRARLTELMEIRDPLYREIADYIIVTHRRGPKAVCAEIAQHLAGKL